MQLPAWAWVLIGGVLIAFFGWLKAARNMQKTFRNPSTAFDSVLGNHVSSMLVMAVGVLIVLVGIVLLAVDIVN